MAHNKGGEDPFTLLVKKYAGCELVKEYKFHPAREWRFDFAIPKRKVAIEVEGGIVRSDCGAHGTSRFFTDLEKYNEAAVEGWRVIRTTPQDLLTFGTLKMVIRACCA